LLGFHEDDGEPGQHGAVAVQHRIASEVGRAAVEQVGDRGPFPARSARWPDLVGPAGRRVRTVGHDPTISNVRSNQQPYRPRLTVWGEAGATIAQPSALKSVSTMCPAACDHHVPWTGRRASPSIRAVNDSAEGLHDDVVCQIVRGELAAAVVWRNETMIAFLDHRPVFKGHVLISPTRHISTLPDLPSELFVPLMATAQRVAAALPEALGAEGTFVAINNVVSQSVSHLHVHVVPRTKGDGLRGFFWPRTKYADGEIDAYAKRIGEALQA
jgi:histidine triad (HIT) family protein